MAASRPRRVPPRQRECVDGAGLRENLASIALATAVLNQELSRRLSSGASAAEVVDTARVLDRLSAQRAEVAARLVSVRAHEDRPTEQGRSARQLVLEALHAIGWPTTARFIEQWIWAHSETLVPSRTLATLRRDDRRAWQRAAKRRTAYVVPALSADGAPHQRWFASSAWDLDRRLVTSHADEELLHLQKVNAILGDPTATRTMLEPLLHYATDLRLATPLDDESHERWTEQFMERYTTAHLIAPDFEAEPLDHPHPLSSTGIERWLRQLRREVDDRIRTIQRPDARARLAHELSAKLSGAEEVWGR